MTVPTLILPVSCSALFREVSGRGVGWIAALLVELAPTDPGGSFVSSIQVAFCRTLVKPFLIGSAVSVATF
jgi:ABC-type uncharacterized transport system permease subunit